MSDGQNEFFIDTFQNCNKFKLDQNTLITIQLLKNSLLDISNTIPCLSDPVKRLFSFAVFMTLTRSRLSDKRFKRLLFFNITTAIEFNSILLNSIL